MTFVKGDMFEGKFNALVNPVNCEGVMGKGLAKLFKDLYPTMFSQYVEECKQTQVRIGEVRCYKEGEATIINFPTKDKGRNNSLPTYIDAGLLHLLGTVIPVNKFRRVAVPALGCGEGGLKWENVKRQIQLWHDTFEGRLRWQEVVVFEPK